MLCHLTAALSLALSIYFFIFIFYFFFCLMSLWVLRCWRQGSRSPIPLPCHHQGRPGRLRRWRAGFLQRTSCCSSGLLVLDAVQINTFHQLGEPGAAQRASILMGFSLQALGLVQLQACTQHQTNHSSRLQPHPKNCLLGCA